MSFSSDPAKSPQSLLREYLYWLPPALIVLVLSLIYLNPFIGDWDGLDYTIFSLHGRPSSMALGGGGGWHASVWGYGLLVLSAGSERSTGRKSCA